MKIRIKRGLDVPFAGEPKGAPTPLTKPKQVALNLDPFDTVRFKLHVKLGDKVKIGQPLAENKAVPGQMFLSPAGGVIKEFRRGLKRRLLDIVIDVAENEEEMVHERPVDSKEALLDFFLRAGIFPHIRLRPFDLIADPKHLPEAIFVRAVESRPFVPSAKLQLEGKESYFQKGLEVLGKIAPVHVVYKEGAPFAKAQGVEHHHIEGPHPAGNSSVHIHHIMPILKASHYRWCVDVQGVITIGKMMLEGTYYVERILSLGGNGVENPSFYRGRMGIPIKMLLKEQTKEQLLAFISGDPLTGTKVDPEEFLGFFHTTVSVLPVNVKREMFHFWRLGLKKYTATRTYWSGFFKKKSYPFTTNQHGEERAFIDGKIYDKVMPMRIPTMQLVKALLAQDYELADILGVFEVAPEDFILPTFICPSKIEMVDMVKQGLHLYSKELGH
ncbi:MAG: Na(+)-translocating NADH-quinone reductase subunit A [Chlamydiales bacterium]|nr:Na(+)-translocating NADH-quinone reductase subunit A [Chlamydiales bacterium]